MHITQNMLYRDATLKHFLCAREEASIQAALDALAINVVHHKFSAGFHRFTLAEGIASQGLILHAFVMLNTIADHAHLPKVLMKMLHCAIEHQQRDMVDFCVNHPRFSTTLATPTTWLCIAGHGPTLLFKQLLKQRTQDSSPYTTHDFLQLALEAISGGQDEILKTLLQHDASLIAKIALSLKKSNALSTGPLDKVFRAHHTTTLRFLLTFESITNMLPTIGQHLLIHAIRNKHAAAVVILLRFPVIQDTIQLPHALVRAASAGDSYTFERLLSICESKQNLLINISKTQHQTINAWTTAIMEGHVGIAEIIFDTVSDAEREELAADVSVLSYAIGRDCRSADPNMLDYLLSFDAMQHEFDRHALRYMKIATGLYPELEEMQLGVRECDIPVVNAMLNMPFIRQKMREGDEALHPLMNLFVTSQLAQLIEKQQQTNAAPLSLNRYQHMLTLLQVTQWHRPSASQDINALAAIPHTLCNDAGVMDPTIKRLLPWTQYRASNTEHKPKAHTLHFLNSNKRKLKHDDAPTASSYSCIPS